MSCPCFPCFQSNNEDQAEGQGQGPAPDPKNGTQLSPPHVHTPMQATSAEDSHKSEAFIADSGDDAAKAFTFRELAIATKNFRQECLLGDCGIGRVYRGTLQSSGQVVAVRQLDRSGTQGGKEFQAEALTMSRLNHPNLVKLIGYCADGDQRLLVYEYIPSGSLKNFLFEIAPGKKALNWTSRMKIASGIAQGLEYLHEKANPPIIYRDLKCSNILLDETNNPRLSEYGLAKLVQSGNKMHVTPGVMTANGYYAPEYEMHGELTPKSDVYSFGVVLLELITGRKALDTTKPADEQTLVSWAQPIFRDPKMYPDMADPLLKKEFPVTSLNQAVGVASMCLQDEPSVRPLITDVVAALSFLTTAPPETPVPARLMSILSSRVDTSSQHGVNQSFNQTNISSHKKANNSDSEEDEAEDSSLKEQEDNDEEEYEESSTSSDDETRDKSREKFKESSKWGSSAKGRSSRRSSSSRSSNSSVHSRDYSIGFSLRRDSSLPEQNLPPHSAQSSSAQETHEHESESDSSSDEESRLETSRSKKPSKNSRLYSAGKSSNSRQESFEGSHSHSSSSSSSEEGSILYPRQDDDLEHSMGSDDETAFEHDHR